MKNLIQITVSILFFCSNVASSSLSYVAWAETDTMDWTQYRGPNGDGVSGETQWLVNWPQAGPNILWRENIGTGYSSFTTKDGRVYTMGHRKGEDIVYCFDADTGNEVWSYPYAAPIRDKQHEGGPGSTPAVNGSRVYTFSREALLHCLDKDTGALIWKKDLKDEIGAKIPTWAFAGSPIIWKEMLVLDTGRTAAFDRVTGNLIWKTKDYGAAYSTPVACTLNGRDCFVVLPEFGLVVLDADTGRELLRHPWETSYEVNAATPIVFGNKIFISSGYNTGCALISIGEDWEPNVVWENKNMRNHINTSVLWDGYLYGFDDRDLACLDCNTGEQMWSQPGLGKGSLTLADGKLIVLSDNGELVVAEASPEGFEPISRAQILGGRNLWTVPVLSGHKIFARNNGKGDMVCVDVSAGRS